eukprot:m.22869 g.22869  ORF g.22869 m.22869 type:complete len:90 (+) comp9298_c0_seq1:87-356(+)
MGGHFGNLVMNGKGFITVALSPYEQRAFAGLFSKSVKNAVRRVTENIPYVLPGIGFGAMVYKFGLDDFNARMRKDPKFFDAEAAAAGSA